MELRKVIEKSIIDSAKTGYRVCKDGGVNTTVLYNYLNGRKDDIKIETLKKLADGIGVPLWEIIKEWEEGE